MFFNKKIIIQTYMFESGLYYLAESLKIYLEKNNCIVKMVPKPKIEFIKNNIVFSYFDPYKIINTEKQLLSTIYNFDPDYIISFETNFITNKWMKNFDYKIIDVPMPEWVQKNQLNNYLDFHQIWCTTNLCFSIFKDYKNAVMQTWLFYNEQFFFPREKYKNISYIHCGSLNKKFSTKNTKDVISAFIDSQTKSQLHLFGFINDIHIINEIKKHSNIIIYNEPISREKFAEIVGKSHCILCPSEREGLLLPIYEGTASGCDIITSNIEPMNYNKSFYLCEPLSFKKDNSFIQIAKINKNDIIKNIHKVDMKWRQHVQQS